MSGIAGIFYLNGNEASSDELRKMTAVLAHRGPDEENFLVSGAVGLGYRRLYHGTDVSESGSQPMSTEDGQYSIIYDGQLYNAAELRSELEQRGCRFHSTADAEVVLQSFREWGATCALKFNGIWAFAIWDKQNESFYCCRDRIGVKPFYYYRGNEIFIFASEIKALLEHPAVPRKVNQEIVYNYLMWGLYGYSEDTFFEDIKELSLSHYAVISKNEMKIQRWWNLDVNLSLGSLSKSGIADAVNHFRTLLEDAVRIRLTDAMLTGITLSGGLDSSAIAALTSTITRNGIPVISQETTANVVTFSSCYENEPMDERAYIEEMLAATGAERNYVFPDVAEFWEELPKMIWFQDEPSGVISVYARWCLMKKVKERGVNLILDGDGSDAMLAGHYRFHGNLYMQLICHGKLLKLFSEYKKAAAMIGFRKLSQVVAVTIAGTLLAYIPASLLLRVRRLFFKIRGRTTDRILVSSFDKLHALSGLSVLSYQRRNFASNLNQRLRFTLERLTCGIKYCDRLAAPFQIESSSPFLDHRLIEYVFSLPATLKIRGGWTKWLLREAMQGILPEKVRLRRDKVAFDTPIRTWLSANKDRIRELFISESVLSKSFINPQFIVDNLEQLLSRERPALEVWRYINLELWLQQFFGDQRQKL